MRKDLNCRNITPEEDKIFERDLFFSIENVSDEQDRQSNFLYEKLKMRFLRMLTIYTVFQILAY